MPTENPRVLTWRNMDQDARLRWAQGMAQDLTDQDLRQAIRATGLGRGPFAIPEPEENPRSSHEAAVNMSRAASLARFLEERRNARLSVATAEDL